MKNEFPKVFVPKWVGRLKVGAREVFLLPWLFFVLGMYPLFFEETRYISPWGFARLIGAILLAGATGVFSRLPVTPKMQFFLTLGLSLVVFQTTIEACYTFILREPPLVLSFSNAFGAIFLLLSFYFIRGTEMPLLPPLGRVGTRDDLMRLSGALEGLALKKGLATVFVPYKPGGENITKELRPTDLIFSLENGYLIFFQETPPEGVGALIRRLKEKHPEMIFSIENWTGGTLRDLVVVLEATASILEDATT